MNELEVKKQLRDWIYGRAKDKPATLDDQTPVIEHGILSSLDVVELVLFIENLRGTEVDVDALEPASFRDVDSMWKSFFEA
jgi:acyl carrier protein